MIKSGRSSSFSRWLASSLFPPLSLPSHPHQHNHLGSASVTMLCLALLTAAAAVSARVLDSVPAVPQGWSKASSALPTDKLALKIGLKQQHAAALEQAVLAVSSPGHPSYGKHLTRDELRSYVAPTEQSVADVTAWLAKYDIVPAVDNDWITISTDVKTANAMLDADFGWYEYEKGGGLKLRTLSYGVPDEIAQHVDLIQPTTRFGQLGSKRSTIFDIVIAEDVDDDVAALKQDVAATAAAAAAPCTTTVTPQCLRAQYNIGYTPEADGNLIAFASYLEEYARYADLESFTTQVFPEAAGQNFSVTTINGGLNDQDSTDDSGE